MEKERNVPMGPVGFHTVTHFPQDLQSLEKENIVSLNKPSSNLKYPKSY